MTPLAKSFLSRHFSLPARITCFAHCERVASPIFHSLLTNSRYLGTFTSSFSIQPHSGCSETWQGLGVFAPLGFMEGHGHGFRASALVGGKSQRDAAPSFRQGKQRAQKEGGEGEFVEIVGPTKTVKIYCAKCSELLYKYRKGGKGALVKCYVERIAEDYTEGDMKCHGCGSEFARARIIKGRQAHKIIGGKVIMRK